MTTSGVRLLGEVCILTADGPVAVTRPQDQRVLAALALGLGAGHAVSMDELIDCCWNGDAPPSARRSLHNAVVRLRRCFEDGGEAIATTPDGYRLRSSIDVDIARAERQLVEAGGLLDDRQWDRAIGIYRDFLAAWEEPFGFGGDHPYWTAVRARWVERRSGALEDLLLAIVHSDDVPDVEELESFVRQTPANERLVGLWALVLHKAHRPAAAHHELHAFAHAIEERGMVVSPMLSVLAQRLPATDSGNADGLLELLEQPRQLHGRPDLFVGRQPELDQLRLLLMSARTRSQVVTIGGPPGIGKSALVREFLAGADVRNHQVLQGRARRDQAAPHGPIVEALRTVLDADHADILRAHVALHGGQLTRLFPAESWPIDAVPSPPAFGDDDQDVLNDAIASLLEALLAQQAVILVIEDAHWLMPSMVELLTYLASRRAPSGLLLLLTTRINEGVSLDFDRGVEHALIRLDPLAVDDVRELLRDSALPDDLSDRVIALCGGQPLLLRQLLAEGGAASGYQLSGGSPLRALVQRRVAALTPLARDVAQALALMEEGDIAGLATVIDARAPETLDAPLTEMATIGLLRQDQHRHRFEHDELRLAVVDAIPRVRRAFLHFRIAAMLERDPDVSPALVAHHLLGASDQGFGSGGAAVWLGRAATQAEASLAFQEAEAFYRQCLAIAGATALDEVDRLEIEIAFGTMLGRLGRWDEADEILVPVWAACVEGGHDRLAAKAALGLSGDTLLGRDRFESRPLDMVRSALELLAPEHHDLRAALHLRMAFLATARGAEDVVARHAHQALAEAELTREPAVLGATLGGLLALEAPHLDLISHRERARRIIETGRLLGHSSLTVTGLIHDATATLMGGHDVGLERFGRIVNLLVREHHEPFARPALSLLLYLRGDLEGAERLVREQLTELALRAGSTDLRMGLFSQLISVLRIQDRLHEIGITPDLRASGHQAGVARLGIARAIADAGDREQARPMAAEVVADLPALLARMPAGVLYLLGEVAEMAVAVGDPALAAPVMRYLRPHEHLNCSAWIHVFGGSVSFHLAQLAVLLGDHVAARRWADHALERHQEMRALPFAARSHLLIGELELAHPDGSPERARRSFEVTGDLGRATGLTALVRRAEVELAELAG